jgi:hypothetical protein
MHLAVRRRTHPISWPTQPPVGKPHYLSLEDAGSIDISVSISVLVMIRKIVSVLVVKSHMVKIMVLSAVTIQLE